MLMAEQSKPRTPPHYQEDEWGTSTRVGYEPRPVYQPRKAAPKRKGSSFLRTLGGLLVVGGLAWIAYVATSPDGLHALFQPGLLTRPILALAAGLLVLLLEKLVR
jgi:hypothetical protein